MWYISGILTNNSVMEFHDFLHLLSKKRKTIYGIIALFLLLGIAVIAVQRFKYSSKSQLLVVQEYDRSVDAYTASKSNEYLSSVLADVVVSNSFFTKVMESGFEVNGSYFGDTTKDQMKEWNRTVSARSINDSGIISVTVYHPNRAEAEKIDRAINYVLMTQNTAYHGSGDAVKVRLIDQPISSSFPVRPDIALTLGLAIALGFLASLVYIYLTPPANAFVPHQYGQRAAYVPHQEQSMPERISVAPVFFAEPAQGQFPEEAFANLASDTYSSEADLVREASMKNILN